MQPVRAPDIEHRFTNAPDAARSARAAIRRLLADTDDPVRDAVTLAASELVTNVVQHTNGVGVLRMWDPKPDVPVRLEVEDFDSGMVVANAAPASAIGGRGLHIVRQLADAWGTFATTAGKVVWAEFDRNRPRNAADDTPRAAHPPAK